MQRWIDSLMASKKHFDGHQDAHHEQHSFHHHDDEPTTINTNTTPNQPNGNINGGNVSNSSSAISNPALPPRSAGMNQYAALLQQQQALHQQQIAQYHSQLRFEQSLFRHLSELQPEQFLFTEGGDLRQYLDWYSLHLDLLIKGEVVESLVEKRRMVCVYVGLKALEQDVHRTGLPYALSAFFTRPLELVSKELLGMWGSNAPVIMSKTENWARRDQSPPLLGADLESVCKWALLCLHHLRTTFLPNDSIHIPIHYSIDQFTDKLLDTLEKLPAAHYSAILWQEVLKRDANVSPQYRGILNAYLVLGKLQLENAALHFPPKNDPHSNAILSDYNRVFSSLSECFRDALLSRLENHIKSFCQQIFASWQATIQLLGPLSSDNSDLMVLQQKNVRILRRVSIGLKEGTYEKLRKALVDCANAIESKLSKTNSSRKHTTAEGEELLYDLLQHLENASN